MLVERARRLLETGGVAFETLPHREAYTAQGVAAATHVSGWTLAKVLVVRAPGEGPVMIVLPASCRLDLSALAKTLGKPSVSLMPESEMKSIFPDCETGAMPPFGQLYGLPVWVVACFPKSGEFAFQAGNHRREDEREGPDGGRPRQDFGIRSGRVLHTAGIEGSSRILTGRISSGT